MDDEAPSSPLIPRAERVVDFYGDPIPIAVVEEEAYVPLRMLTDFLELNWSGQRQRVARDQVLRRHVQTVEVTAADGKRYDMLCLELAYLPGWLFGISSSRVREDLQEKLTRYREECFKVLWRSFQAELGQFQPPVPVSTAPLEQVRNLGLAIVTLAEQQMALQGRVDEIGDLATSAHNRIDRAAEEFKAIRHRLSTVEGRVSPASYITDEQAAEVSGQVKALAELLTGKDASKNQYQSIFAELYRRFGVSSYKLIRQDQYQTVLAFLDDWRKTAIGK